MKPTKNLIRALRETAADLRSNCPVYNWIITSQCNCGLLAQKLIGEEELRVELHRNYVGAWQTMSRMGFCSETGLPVQNLFKLLFAEGLEMEDFNRIENLDGDYLGRANPLCVANWMDARADELEKRRSRETGEKPL